MTNLATNLADTFHDLFKVDLDVAVIQKDSSFFQTFRVELELVCQGCRVNHGFETDLTQEIR
jgi:hypothetical protein